VELEIAESGGGKIRRRRHVAKANHEGIRTEVEDEQVLDGVAAATAEGDGPQLPCFGGSIEEADPAVVVKTGQRLFGYHVLNQNN